MNRVGLLIFAALVGISSARAQAPNALPPSLASLVDAYGGVGSHELEAVARGDVAVVSLREKDKDEIALLALVAVAVPHPFYAAHAWDIAGSESPARTSGVVREPATPADFEGLSLTDGEVKGLKKCRPLRCALKLPVSEMASIAAAADAKTDRTAGVNTALRNWLAALVNDFRARGDSSLPHYDDTRLDEKSAEGFARLLDQDAPLLREAPALGAHLRGASIEDVAGIEASIHWTVDHPEGLSPIASVVQHTTYIAPDPRLPTLLITKQLYASHYFDARLEVTALAEGAGETPDTYALVVRRVRFDKLPNGGMFDVRGRVVRKLRNALRDELAASKRRLESAYRSSRQH